jgi:hypothetical protein
MRSIFKVELTAFPKASVYGFWQNPYLADTNNPCAIISSGFSH